MKSGKLAGAILVGMGVFAMVGIGVVVGRATGPLSPWRVVGWAMASLVFGVLVGLSEIISRYRDEPVRASTTAFGLAYLLLNGVLSLAAFMLLRRYSQAIFPSISGDLFLTALVAGFGGMIVFRSKLFTFRSPDGKEYAIGPAIVLETVLRTIDQKIDRRRATERQLKVFAALGNLNDFATAANYFEASLLSFQNLTQEEKGEVSGVIKQYREASIWPDSLKMLGLGFAFLNIAGEENFDQVVANLKQFLESQAPKVTAPSGSPGVSTSPGASPAPPPLAKAKASFGNP